MLSAVQVSEIPLQKYVQDVSEELHFVCDLCQKEHKCPVAQRKGRAGSELSSSLAGMKVCVAVGSAETWGILVTAGSGHSVTSVTASQVP